MTQLDIVERNTCEMCRHFRVHYIRSGNRYIKLNYGHCVYPRRKKRNADKAACEHYSARSKEI